MRDKDIVVVCDPQVYEGVPITHLTALSEFLWKNKPGHIVHIGDHFDFPSLSYYASRAEKEGRRLKGDLLAGYRALKEITRGYELHSLKSKGKANYKPTLDFCMGNHEQRLNRYIEEKPELIGVFDLQGDIESRGWNFHKFLEPVWINGVCFRHFLSAPHSGRAIGGSVENKMNKTPHPFVQGHVQQYQFARRQNVEGRPHFGVVAGSFYQHDEAYRGYDNTEARGFVYMKHFVNRYGFDDYDVEFVSLERLMEIHG